MEPLRTESKNTLTVEVEEEGALALIRAKGEVDLASVALLDSELKRAEASGADRIVLDLSELEFIDSTGLRALVEAQKRSRSDRLTIKGANRQVLQMIELTGLHALIDQRPDRPS
jgi:anti-sigma B factor antagonist